MRVLVTGASGGLGRYVTRALRELRAEVLAPTRAEMDVADADAVDNYVGKWQPESVVHLAAMTDVAGCEVQPEQATLLNAVATRHVAEAATHCRWCRRLVYMSTDAVLSGAPREGGLGEDAQPAPRGVYAWSKYAGEEIARAHGALVVRANFFTRYCRAKQSFVAYALSTMRGTEAPRTAAFYSNVRSTPVHASTLANVLANRAVRFYADFDDGVLHVCSSDAINRVDQARRILTAYGLPDSGVTPFEAREPYDGRLTSVRDGVAGTVDEEIAKMVASEPLED